MLNENEQEKIVNHYAKYFEVKPKEMGYIRDESKKEFKVDLFWIKPRKNYRFHTLATMGLSDYQMIGGNNEYVELIMVMPESWRITDDEGEHVWQVQFLRNVAHEIKKNSLNLQYGDLIIPPDITETISPQTNMYCGLVVLPEVYSPKIFNLKQGKGKLVKFYALTTLTKAEFEKANSRDICDFIDEDLSTEEQGAEIFVVDQRGPKKTYKKLVPSVKPGKQNSSKDKLQEKNIKKKKEEKTVIKKKK